MPLEPHSQEIPFRFGLDYTEDEVGSPGGALELTNFDFTKEGALVRRNGFTKLSGTSAGPSEASTSEYRGLLSNDETLGILVRGRVVPNTAGGNGGYAGFGPFDHDTLGTYWNGVRTQSTDIATLTGADGNKYLCVVATVLSEATGTELDDAVPDFEVHAKVINLNARTVVYDARIANGTLGVNSAFGARVVAYTGAFRFGIFYNLGSTFKFNYIDTTTLSLGSAVNVVTATDHAFNIGVPDVVCDGTNAYAVVCDGAALKVKKVNSAGTVSASTTLGGLSTENAILLLTNGTTLGVVNSSGVVFEVPTTLASSTFSATPTSPGTVKQIGLVETAANGQLTILFDTTVNVRVYTYNVGTLTAPASAITAPNVQLMGKPWYHTFPFSGRQAYVPVAARNVATSGYRTVVVMAIGSLSLDAVGQVTFDEAGAPHTYLASTLLSTVLADPTDSSATRFLYASLADLETGDARATSGGLPIDRYVRRVRVSRLSFGVTNVVTSAALGGLVHVSGSLPLTWDGSTLGPAAFVDAPAAPVLTSPNAGLLTGTYSYCVVYEVSDERGNIQVSPPSVGASATVTSKKITVTHAVSPLAYRTLPGLRNLRVKIYRTQAGASVYYLAHTYTAVYGGTVTVDDNVIDSTLAGAETIYTTGGALESEPSPPLRFLCAHRNRLFGIRSDVPQNIPYTQETTDPFNPRWHAVLNHRVDNDGGAPTALASLFDKVLVFQENQICAFYGLGPDATGAGAFAQAEVVARGVGVADADRGSVVTTPVGVFFKHRSGIHVIGPDFQAVPVGRAVADLVGNDTCVRARFLPSRHQVWFLFQNPSTLTTRQYLVIFDTRFNRWVKWTTPVVFEDVLEHAGTVYAISRTALFKFDTATCIDTGGSTSLFSQVIAPPWFRGPDRAQELRLWKVHVAGRKVAGAQNDANVALEVFTQDERKTKSSTAADNTLTWPGSAITGMADNFLLSARVVSQRCRAFRCRLTVTPQTSDPTSTWYTLGALVYDFGALMGRGKQPSGKRPTIS